MHQDTETISIQTRGPGLYEITPRVVAWVRELRITTGVLTLFVQHTSASLLCQENADPEVQRDLERFFRRLVPDGDPLFHHVAEGSDDMPAHVKAALTATTLTIPIDGGRVALGTWQGLFLYEHRHKPHRRRVLMHAIGEAVE
ncbi:MAG: secondary thiamine-phosphate synthase enzyme YjbQ [Nitrospirota bacterium]|jgi:secondary thiamine-phosphate synthase enzyme